MVAPAFSAANMRQITPLIQSLMLQARPFFFRSSRSIVCSPYTQLQGVLREQVANGPKEIDILDWMSRLALEAIAQAGMGHTFGALEGTNDEYGRAVKETMYVGSPCVFPPSHPSTVGSFSTALDRPTFARLQAAAVFLPFVTRHGSPGALRWLAQHAPLRALRDMVKISDTLHFQAKEVWERKKALFAQGDDVAVDQIGGGKDLMSILREQPVHFVLQKGGSSFG